MVYNINIIPTGGIQDKRRKIMDRCSNPKCTCDPCTCGDNCQCDGTNCKCPPKDDINKEETKN